MAANRRAIEIRRGLDWSLAVRRFTDHTKATAVLLPADDEYECQIRRQAGAGELVESPSIDKSAAASSGVIVLRLTAAQTAAIAADVESAYLDVIARQGSPTGPAVPFVPPLAVVITQGITTPS